MGVEVGSTTLAAWTSPYVYRQTAKLALNKSFLTIQEDEIFFSRGEKNIFNTPKKCGCNDSVPNLCSLSVFVAQTPFLLAAEFRGFLQVKLVNLCGVQSGKPVSAVAK